MESINRLRRANQRLAARIVSSRPHHSTMFVAQRTANGNHSELKGLPAIACDPIQNQDAGSENFGDWLYIAGVTPMGGAPMG